MTFFNTIQERRRLRWFIANHELPAIGLAVSANLDRAAAKYQRVGEELLRDGFLRDWILDGEEDEEELRAFLETVRLRFGMMDASIVSDRTETYYGTDGRTVHLSPDNWERDGWYYLYREETPEANIDTWYYPETGRVGMWGNVPIPDADGSFLGVTGGGVEATEFTETLHSYGELSDISIYLARRDGQLVYAADRNLLKDQSHIDDVSGIPITELVDGDQGATGRLFGPAGAAGPALWARYSEPWDTFILVEHTGEALRERSQGLLLRSLLAGGALTASLYALTLAILLAARKRIAAQTRQLEDANRLLADAAGEDVLTGLYNRLRFTEFVEREVSLIRRDGEESCLLMLDLDHFKVVNDTYGHPTGDAALHAVADVIRSQLRETDVPARFGGEEFAVLLPRTSIAGAVHVAEKIRRAIESGLSSEHTETPQLTVSIGVTSLSYGEEVSLDAAYRRADDALYRAKRNGRNRVECFA